jgi:hypothetical protein
MSFFLWGLSRGSHWVCIPKEYARASLPLAAAHAEIGTGTTTAPVLAFHSKDYNKAQDALVLIKAVHGITTNIRRIK